MIYKKCSWHGCSKIVKETEKYCNYHEGKAKEADRKRYREYYNRIKMDEDRKRYMDFYSSKAWIKLSESIKMHFLDKCIICWLRGYEDIECSTTHHIEELKKRYDLRLVKENLVPLCSSCHQKVHAEYNKGSDNEEKMKKIIYEAIKRFNDKFY